MDTQQDVSDHYEALYDAFHAQETRCARLEREIQADRKLAESFVKFVSYKYNSLYCKLQIATRLAEEYRQELGQIGQLEMEMLDLRFSLLDAIAACHKDEERFRFQLAAVQHKLAATLASAKSANEQAIQASNSENHYKSRQARSKPKLHETRLQLDAVRIERDQLAQKSRIGIVSSLVWIVCCTTPDRRSRRRHQLLPLLKYLLS